MVAMDGLDATIDSLRRAQPEHFSELFVTHEPNFKIVVSFAGSATTESRELLAELGSDVEIREDSRFNESELDSEFRSVLGAVREVYPAAGGGYSPIDGVEIVIHGTEYDEPGGRMVGDNPVDALDRVTEEVSAGGLPVHVTVGSWETSSQHARAGNKLTGGGDCTSGFAAKRWISGVLRRGITTAGHCPNSQQYIQNASNQYAAPVYNQMNNPTSDSQFNLLSHHGGTNDAQPKMKTSSSTWTNVTAIRPRSYHWVGMIVCHYGIGTPSAADRCGQVRVIGYAPPDVVGCSDVHANGPCDPNWIAVKDVECNATDSGGPWYTSTIAAGIHSGKNWLGDPWPLIGNTLWPGGLNDCLYMPIDNVQNALGVQILTVSSP